METLELQLLGLRGLSLELKASASCSGRELWRLAARKLWKPGAGARAATG